MPLGHGSIAEFAVASVRGGGVQNVGSPFISGVGGYVDDMLYALLCYANR